MISQNDMAIYFEWFVSLLTIAVSLFDYPEVDPNFRPINVPNQELLSEYDFIIVGSGAAGSPLASRLSEIGHWTVLLLEAGGDETVASDIPALSVYNRLSNINWNYSSVPQEYVCRATGGVCNLPRGKVIGGSTTLNDLVWFRGNRLDYDGWASQGNPGWSYRDVLPYFIRLENNTDPSVVDSPYHGRGGPVTIGRSRYHTGLLPHYLETFKELGYQETDLDGESQVGYMINRAGTIDGFTCSTGRGYLRPIRNRTNLNVAENAFVTKININPGTKITTGVTVMRYGQEITITAKKEVLLSAGVFNSPQLLMLSGIGPAEHLREMKIDVIQDSRVGDNLQNPVSVLIPIAQSSVTTLDFKTLLNLPNLREFAFNGTGPLTSLDGVEAGGNLYYENPPRTPGLPDVRCDFGSLLPYNLNSKVFYVSTTGLGFTSRGTIRLASTDPTIQPLIDPKFLSNAQDKRITLDAMRTAFRIINSSTLQRIDARLATELTPLCNFSGNITDEFLWCLIENYAIPPVDFLGSCKMGPSSDESTVVDPRLRVHGVKNLRVVDASIIPTYPHATPTITVIMIGERASDLIKEDYGEPISPLPQIPSSA